MVMPNWAVFRSAAHQLGWRQANSSHRDCGELNPNRSTENQNAHRERSGMTVFLVIGS
jgi:hypothetical protein